MDSRYALSDNPNPRRKTGSIFTGLGTVIRQSTGGRLTKKQKRFSRGLNRRRIRVESAIGAARHSRRASYACEEGLEDFDGVRHHMQPCQPRKHDEGLATGCGSCSPASPGPCLHPQAYHNGWLPA